MKNLIVSLLFVFFPMFAWSQETTTNSPNVKLDFFQVRYIERIDSTDSVAIANLLPFARFDEIVLPKKERINSIDVLRKKAAMIGGTLLVVQDSQEVRSIKTSLLEGTGKSLFGVNPVKVKVVYGTVYGKPLFSGDSLRQVLANKTWRWFSTTTADGYELQEKGKQYFFAPDGKLLVKGKEKGRYALTREGLLIMEENGIKTILNVLHTTPNQITTATLQSKIAEQRVFVLTQN